MVVRPLSVDARIKRSQSAKVEFKYQQSLRFCVDNTSPLTFCSMVVLYCWFSKNERSAMPTNSDFELLPGDLTVSRAKQLLEQAQSETDRLTDIITESTKKWEESEKKIGRIIDGADAALNTQLEAGKSLAVLNSAGAAGALAFAQALYAKGALNDFRFFVVVATSFFLLGAFAGASTPKALVNAKMLSGSGESPFKYMGPARWCLRIASIAFAVGSLMFLWGIATVQ